MVSIYEAEVRKKYKVKEDQLTSRVFGALAMLPKQTVLLPFLELLAKDTASGQDKDAPVLSKITSWRSEGVKSANISLWKYAEGSYPDIYIKMGDFVIVIEVKKAAPATTTQIVEQYSNAVKLGEKKREGKLAYFLLTNDDKIPDAVNEAQEELRGEFPNARIHWRRWPQVWKWLKEIQGNQEVNGVSQKLLEATIKLLEANDMAYPTGFKKNWFDEKVCNALDRVQELCREIRLTIKEVNAKLEEKGLEKLGNQPDLKITGKLGNHDEWVPRSFLFYFKDKHWTKVKDPNIHPSLCIEFNLESDYQGVGVGLLWNDPNEELVKEVRERISGLAGAEVDDKLWADDGELSVGWWLSAKDLSNSEAPDKLLCKLVQIRDFANKLEELRGTLGLRTARVLKRMGKGTVPKK